MAVELQSYVPGRWHIWQSLSTPGYVVCQKPSVVDSSCQVKLLLRSAAPWMAWMKSFWLPDHALLVWFGLWQKLQVAASLRWPAWKSGPTPSVTWQPSHLALATMARRPVKPVATFETSGGGTIRPPTPAKVAFGV